MPKKDLNLIEAVPIRTPAPAAPGASLSADLRAQIIRLTQGLVKQTPAWSARKVMFTGARSGVGTSFTVRAVSEVASELGYAVDCLKLNESDTMPMLPAASPGAPQQAPGGLEISSVSMLSRRVEQSAVNLMLVDAPPIAQSAVAMRFAASVEGVVLVVAAGSSREREIHSALETIANCGGTCLGMVLNRRPGHALWRF